MVKQAVDSGEVRACSSNTSLYAVCVESPGVARMGQQQGQVPEASAQGFALPLRVNVCEGGLQDRFASERRRAKTLNFSIAYGKTAKG